MSDTLTVCEIFRSIQGESTYAGLPCNFIRLAGCNLSCSWCDTQFAQSESEGTEMSLTAISEKINTYSGNLIEITGGEPLLQKATSKLVERLIKSGKTVLVETNGSQPIDLLPESCIRIIDVKCPSSGMHDSFILKNLQHLRNNDEMKFVIGSREDFDYTRSFITQHHLAEQLPLIVSPVAGTIDPVTLAEWILATAAPVRLQLQLHKLIWGEKRGV